MNIKVDPRREYLQSRANCLARLKRAERKIQKVFPRFTLDTIPPDDPKALEQLLSQPVHPIMRPCWKEKGFSAFLRRLKPASLIDLAAAMAVYGPGTMRAGIDRMLLRAKAKKAFRNGSRGKTHSLLSPFTQTTHGLLLFQEQFMEAAKLLAGFSTKEANELRRIKFMEKFEHYHKRFVSGAMRNGHRRSLAEHAFEQIEEIGRYAFNRSHALDTATIVYRMAYLRTYYPNEFGPLTRADRFKPRPDSMYVIKS